ncbi:MAG: thioesterase domain-containing protein [Gammaproteobacteria bacterium]|nr:thioesterase domain-containing protein [Gammaproteobacteria bacterium]MDH5799776.1 thioesterase domain-containing protein [Gammaproteobacteria bacterium]
MTPALKPKLTPQQLQDYLHLHIPLSKAMEVKVAHADIDKVTLTAPLAPNINHKETVFGGSAAAVAILSAWTLLHYRLTLENLPSQVVIQRNSMDYDKPIRTDFSATALPPDMKQWEKFSTTLKRRHRARLSITAILYCEEEPVGSLEGTFVALRQG